MCFAQAWLFASALSYYRNLHMFWPQLEIALDEHSIEQVGAIADEHVSKPSDPRAERQWAVHDVNHNEGIVSSIASRMSSMKSSRVFLRSNGREGLQFIRPKTLPQGMSSIKSSTYQPNVQVWQQKTYGRKWRSQMMLSATKCVKNLQKNLILSYERTLKIKNLKCLSN